MMLTKEQARAVWCPMVRLVAATSDGSVATEQPSFNRVQLGSGARKSATPTAGNCIADECAMWRWVDPAVEPRDVKTWWPEEDEPHVEPPRPAKVPASAVWIPLSGEGDDMEGGHWQENQAEYEAAIAADAAGRRGYCGLAGKPGVL